MGAAVFTSDEKRGELIVKEKLDAGCCFVNDFVKSEPKLPFGGINDSVFGIRGFVNIKTVYVK